MQQHIGRRNYASQNMADHVTTPIYNGYGSSSVNHRLKAHRPRRADMEGEPTQALQADVSKYLDYPVTKPFINTDLTRPAGKPIDAYPTSDRDAIISSLKNLQEKVNKLELERTTAVKNLRHLTEETKHVKEIMTSHPKPRPSHRVTSPRARKMNMNTNHTTTNQQTRVKRLGPKLEGQLTNAESRCQVLEQQLDYMRNLVRNSDRQKLVENNLSTQNSQGQSKIQADVALQIDRLRELERDQLRLTATQTLAEAKIKELEEEVREEKLHRKTLQSRTQLLETVAREKKPSPVKSENPGPAPSTRTSPKSPPSLSAPSVIRSKKPPKKKKKKSLQPNRRPSSATTIRSEASGRHYRLNLAEIPFVAGKSTSASHSLGANVQKVLAMMKNHNSALCTGHDSQRTVDTHRLADTHRCESSSSCGSSVASTDELNDILSQLQDEFGQLTSEHQDLVNQIHECRDSLLRDNLEQDLDVLVARMEAKSQQITKVRHHQQKLDEGKKNRPQTVKNSNVAKRPHSAGAKLSNGHYSNYQHSSRTKPAAKSKVSGSTESGKPALHILRDMKKLQTTLRRDDLSWE